MQNNTDYKIEAGLRKGLKDPDSAKFGFMNAARADSGLIAVCGWMNAKNSFGGYVGEQPFYGSYVPEQHTAVLIVAGEGNSPSWLVQNQCIKNGTTIERTAISSDPIG
jgi:hypothetical protein